MVTFTSNAGTIKNQRNTTFPELRVPPGMLKITAFPTPLSLPTVLQCCKLEITQEWLLEWLSGLVYLCLSFEKLV